MADTAPAQPRAGGTDAVLARLQRGLELLFPSNLAGKAVLFAVVVALLPLLPTGTGQTPRIWELPHILLLGLVISYGVFGQRNADADVVPAPVAASSNIVDDDESVEAFVSQILQGPLVFEGNSGDGGGSGAKEGGVQAQAWSSQYYPDDPLVVVANDAGDASEKPRLLPVRKLKPAAPEESAPGNVSDDGIDEEAECLVPREGSRYGGAREHAMASPSSVLDAGLALSPCSPPPPPPPPQFLGGARGLDKAKARSFNEYGVGDRGMSARAGLRSRGVGSDRFRSNSAIQATRRNTFSGYDPVAPSDDQVPADDKVDDMDAASDSSFSSDDMARDGDDEHDEEENSYNGEGEEEGREGDNSSDEELFELATRPEPEEDEVDRKADEFIAKFREQIRMQRVQPGPGRR